MKKLLPWSRIEHKFISIVIKANIPFQSNLCLRHGPIAIVSHFAVLFFSFHFMPWPYILLTSTVWLDCHRTGFTDAVSHTRNTS